MSEKRILLASLLKPINDTRMYEKLGLSLSKLPDTEIHICGFSAPTPALAPANITFHPLFNFTRLSIGRLRAQVSFYKLLQSLKPDLVIVCTHELLLAAYFYCRASKAKLVYDVQENYALNIRSQQNYPYLVRHLLAYGIELLEKFVAPTVDHFILAEKCYARELSFLGKSFTVLENKYKPGSNYIAPNTPVQLNNTPLRLLYSGTIALEYGIIDAIALTDQLYTLAPDTSLTIIGYCANSNTWQQVQQQVKDKPYIRIIGGDQLVPHSQIIDAMREANVGLLPYRAHPSTANCIPTKLFEYMAHGLVILISQNPIWQGIVQEHQAGIGLNFFRANAPVLVKQVRTETFYYNGIPNNIFWDSEEDELLNLIKAL